MADRLRLPRIEGKKDVSFIRGHGVTVPLTDEQRQTLLLIRERIAKGQEIPAYCYRVNRDTTPDDLLQREGIMHLHLSPKDRNATLFLIQYSRHVVFLGVNDHAAFKDDPPGSTLYRLHRNAILDLEDRIDTVERERTDGLKKAVASGLKARPPTFRPTD